jgi:hypothetical protein
VRDLPQQVINSLPVQAPCQKKRKLFVATTVISDLSGAMKSAITARKWLMTSVLCGAERLPHQPDQADNFFRDARRSACTPRRRRE